MNIASYINERNAVLEQINGMDILSDTGLVSRFSLMSANLHQFMPELPGHEHMQYFKEILIHQRLSMVDQKYPESLQFVCYEGLCASTLQLLKEKPCIICTFHSGSYRIINTFLMQQQIPYALVVASDIAAKQGSSYFQTFDTVYDGYINDAFTLINAESSASGLQMLKALKKGKSLLVYIDGNTGAIKNDPSKYCPTSFMKGSLCSRYGIPYLAHAANVPILNAVSFRKTIDQPVIRFSMPIYPDQQQSRKLFAFEAVRHIYKDFESIARQYPQQWEAWLYLHKSIAIPEDQTLKKYSVAEIFKMIPADRERFGLIHANGNYFLLDKRVYQTYSISRDEYTRLVVVLYKNT